MQTFIPSDSIQSKYNRIFFALAFPVGLLYVFLSPAFNVPDEQTHFFRIYHLAEGHILAEKQGNATGAMLPKSLGQTTYIYTFGIHSRNNGKITIPLLRSSFDIPLHPQEQEFTAFSNTALYSFVPYLPQITAIWICKAFGLGPMYMLYAGRLLVFIVSIILLTWAVKAMPFLKPLFILAVLTPTSMYQLASLSADSITIAVCGLLFALIMRYAFDETTVLRTKDVVILLLLSLAVCLSKSTYFLIPALVFLIPKNRFPNPALHILSKSLVAGSGLIALAIWSYLVQDIYSPPFQLDRIDPEAAKNFILAHPLQYASILLQSIIYDGWNHVQRFIGIQDWDLLLLPSWLSSVYAGAIALTAVLRNDSSPRVPWFKRVSVSIAGWATLALILTVVYVSWTPPGAPSIVGMQGRYLIPIIPLLLFPVYGLVRIPAIAEKLLARALPLFIEATLLAALVLNVLKFYTI